jgi:putative transcriptional regulator
MKTILPPATEGTICVSEDVLKDIRSAMVEYTSGKGKRYAVLLPEMITSARLQTELSQQRFAELLGISVRTLQQWEQGRRMPSGAARTLLLIALRNPEILRAL